MSDSNELANEIKKSREQINDMTINLLLCKLCCSSILELSKTRLINLFDYSLSILKDSNKSGETNNEKKISISSNELETLLNLSSTIFKNFSRTEIIKPFLVNLIDYFDQASKYSQNKFIVFEFICNQFYQNENLNK